MKIFYSWQSDTPSKIGKAFIRSALDVALENIKTSMDDLVEAERPHIDQDTQGILGSPDIANTIFEKIRNSDVVVVDVTLVGEVEESKKKLINSNVAIELGFARGHHGDHVMLQVMNTYYSSFKELPFDLTNRRKPVSFKLSPDADKKERDKECKKLAKTFEGILSEYIKNGHTQKKEYEPIPSTDNPAMYWNDGNFLVDETLNANHHSFPQLGYRKDQPLIYLRIWPKTPLKELKGVELRDLKSKSVPFLNRAGNIFFARNKYGIIGYSVGDTDHLYGTTQIFKNREIWGVDAYILSHHGKPKEFRRFNYVPIGAVETELVNSLERYTALANDLEYPELVSVEFGMVNVKSFPLVLSQTQYSEPILEDIVVKTKINRNDPDSMNSALLKIMEKVYDAVGLLPPP